MYGKISISIDLVSSAKVHRARPLPSVWTS